MAGDRTPSIQEAIDEARSPAEAAGMVGALSVYRVVGFPLRVAGKVADLLSDAYYSVVSAEDSPAILLDAEK